MRGGLSAAPAPGAGGALNVQDSGCVDAPRFNRQSERLKERYGERVWRLGLDGGFGCPNRGGGRGPGGCIYCAPDGDRSPYLDTLSSANLDAQVEKGLSFLEHRYKARLFFLYFQAYSSTFAPVEVLRARYDEAIASLERRRPGSLRGLVVSTRPDCLSEEKAGLLASYAARGLEVWVELGLQSGRDSTLRRINRGHSVADFSVARELLRRPGIHSAAHLILGLPGESDDDMLSGARLVAELRMEGVKFHDLYVARGSTLGGDYLAGEISLISEEHYLMLLADAVELLPPDMEILRLSSDGPSEGRLAPKRQIDKTKLYVNLERELEARGTRQGAHFRASLDHEAGV